MSLKRKHDFVADEIVDVVDAIFNLMSKYTELNKQEQSEMIAEDVFKSHFNIFDTKEECVRYVKIMTK